MENLPLLYQKIRYFIENYKEEKQEDPNKMIVNDFLFSKLEKENLLVQKADAQANKDYTGERV